LSKDEHLESFLQKWISVLNKDRELRYRVQTFFEADDPSVLSLKIPDLDYAFTVGLQGKTFILKYGLDRKPMLEVTMPSKVFRKMLLSEEPIIEALVEDGTSITSDHERYNHERGATVIEMLVVAQELVESDGELKRNIMSMR